MMQLHVVIAIDHNPTPVGVELFVASHPPMPREVLLQADEYLLAQLPLEDCCAAGRLAIA
jgi:hypothetical protein